MDDTKEALICSVPTDPELEAALEREIEEMFSREIDIDDDA